jgi:hypothetical protein
MEGCPKAYRRAKAAHVTEDVTSTVRTRRDVCAYVRSVLHVVLVNKNGWASWDVNPQPTDYESDRPRILERPQLG